MLNLAYLEELEAYLKSGRMEDDFQWSAEGRRHEMLEFLEKLMDVAELADEAATRMIFKGSLGALAGVKDAAAPASPASSPYPPTSTDPTDS